MFRKSPKSKHNIPRTMSTQHPDNVMTPFFSDHAVLQGEDEVKEAYFAFAHLGSEEIMWDAEGKEIDTFVIRKLLTNYKDYFTEHVLGRDKFITLRVPNPEYEKAEAKILLETLESIPRSYDTAQAFYQNNGQAPIFEVIVPMANEQIINRIYDYYKNVVIGKEHMVFTKEEKLTVTQWIGEFKPEKVNVIPLFEDFESMKNIKSIMTPFIESRKDEMDYSRVFLARSDPAMNYSSLAVIIALTIALEDLAEVEKETGVPIYPILGCGTAPFRGNFSPKNAAHVMSRYPSVATYTIQSAFKYDSPIGDVQSAIKLLNETPVKPPLKVKNREKLLELADRLISHYQSKLEMLAPLVNDLSKFVPKRRARKLHVGLFGYSRELREGVTLPRVISFCAVLYSIGLPPDLIGLDALTPEDIKLLRNVHPRLQENIGETLSLYNPRVLEIIPESIREQVRKSAELFKAAPINLEHLDASNKMIDRIKSKSFDPSLTDLIVVAGNARGFLG
jgi:phosphoenolpyruvate carboxylase